MPKKRIPKHGRRNPPSAAKQTETTAEKKSCPPQELHEAISPTCEGASSMPGSATALYGHYNESDVEQTALQTQETVGTAEALHRKMEEIQLRPPGQQPSDTMSQVTLEEKVQPVDMELPSGEPRTQTTTEASGMVMNNATQETSVGSPQGCKKISSSGLLREGHSGHSKSKDIKLPQLLLQADKDKLDSSYYPVLVVNTPLKEESMEEVKEKFGFTSRVNWNVVFDCNPNSNMTGLCKYVKGTKPVKILSPEKFAEVPEKDVSDFRNDINFPEETTWVFLNGRKDIVENPQEKLPDKEWTKLRSKAVQNTVDFFTNPKVIPGNRAVVVFLLLSDCDLLAMCSVFRQLYISKYFEVGNFTIFAEDSHHVTRFMEELEKMAIIDSEDLKERHLAGIPWQEINMHMSLMVGPVETQPKLPMSNGKNCSLPVKVRKQWSDLTVLAQNECENISRDQDKEAAEEVERKFYQGHEVDWLNFYLSEKKPDRGKRFDHVLERDVFKNLKGQIERDLESSQCKSNDIPVIKILHEAGAGGTTVAKHALWDLHKRVRCGVVNRITQNTVKQIEEFRRHGYGKDNPGPVILMIDDIDPEIFHRFLENLEKGTKSQGYVSDFILLRCMRVPDPETLKSCQNPCVAVQHKLSRKEIAWFTNKTKDLEARNVFSEQNSPEELLGFMAMKNECESEYLRNVVNRIMPTINSEMPQEQRKQVSLLKYISLMQMYNPDFAMPLAACDELMQKSHPFIVRRLGAPSKCSTWEKDRPRYMKILLIEEHIDDIDASAKGLRVFHSRIAKIIVEELCIHLDEKAPDMFLQLLDSPILRTLSHTKDYVEQKCRDIMVCRLTKDDGNVEDFSTFIQEVCEDDKDTAFEILQKGIDRFRDGIIAQQKARLHKHYDELTLAKEAIECAISLSPKSSFIQDTKGLILQAMMIKTGQVKSMQRLTPEEVNELMTRFDDASEAFQKAQEHMELETSQNFAGFVNEIDLIFKLLEIVQKKVKPFCFPSDGEERLARYLTSDIIPSESSVLSEHHETLKNLEMRVEAAFERVEDYKNQCAHNEISKGQYKLFKLPRLYQDRKKFFYTSVSSCSDSPRSPVTSSEGRRANVKAMGIYGYKQVFEFASGKKTDVLKKVQRILEANLRSPKLQIFDVKVSLSVSVALLVCCNEPFSNEDEVRWLVETLKELEKEKEGFYGLFFDMLLSWHDVIVHKHSPKKIKSSVEDLKRRWMNRYHKNHRDESLHTSRGRTRLLQAKPPKPSAEFYLGKDKAGGVRNLVYRRARFGRWEQGDAPKLLERLEGFLRDNYCVCYKPKGCEPIEIRLAFPLNGVPSEERVQFYLGFSFAGPIAYDPKTM